jgi:hypothetical protein
MQSKTNITRQTVDLSSFPDLVVIYLGMKVRTLRGFLTVLSFGPRISAAIAQKPQGLLLHEPLFSQYSPCMWVCGSTGGILIRLKRGRDPCRTRLGGKVL